MIAFYASMDEFLRTRPRKALEIKESIRLTVEKIIRDVRENGDTAVTAYTQRFDGAEPQHLLTPQSAMEEAANRLDRRYRDLFERVVRNIRQFHLQQRPESWRRRDTHGTILGMQFRAIGSVGCYVPGGTAAYPSTVLMTVIPAQVAGVPEIAITTPPDKTGKPSPYVLATAMLLGVKRVYAVGGAQAIAALAYGTESVNAVDKIVGPGNIYVNEAKRQVFGHVGIDSLAGPTELAVLADPSVEPEWVVRDLFAQAEHDNDATVLLISPDGDFLRQCQVVVNRLLPDVPRKDILTTALVQNGALVAVRDSGEGAELINRLAPEHVQLMTKDAKDVSEKISCAGAICIGPYSPAVVGDYFAGPNHVLPTGRTARFASPLNVMDFMTFSSIMQITREGCLAAIDDIAAFASLEGLENHKEAVLCRKK